MKNLRFIFFSERFPPLERLLTNVNRSVVETIRFVLLASFASLSQAQQSSPVQRLTDSLEAYMNVSLQPAKDFRPLTQAERNELYIKSLASPWSYMKGAVTAGVQQIREKPIEWGGDSDDFLKRYASVQGQYNVRKTVTFLSSSLLHEDNRYFASGRRGLWPRVGYAVESSVLARRDDGTRTISISQLGGEAAGAYAAQWWLPPSQNHPRDGAIRFAIAIGGNAAVSVVKEFLPDLSRALRRKSAQKTSFGRF